MKIHSLGKPVVAVLLISMFMFSFRNTFIDISNNNSIKPDNNVKEGSMELSDKASSNSSANNAKPKKIKIALLLDTSNSMDGLIEQAKSQLWTLVEELAKAKCENEKPHVEIALYEYGNDRLSEREGFIKMVTPLTSDLDKISDDLFKLTTNGGSEYCGHVIRNATRQLNWDVDGNNYQVIFIAGNEEFTQGNVPYKEACSAAKNKNIIVNTIYCGPYEEGTRGGWKSGAELTNGSYMSIEQDRQTVFIPSPYDDKIAHLNSTLNTTYIEYGSTGKEKKLNQELQDVNAQKYGSQNSVKRAISKTTHIYKNDSWDLIDASEEKSFEIEKIDSESLADNMKKMSTQQKTKYIQDKKAERKKIKTEITELNRKRELYVSQQKKNDKDSDKMLDNALLKSIRKQATTKNFTF